MHLLLSNRKTLVLEKAFGFPVMQELLTAGEAEREDRLSQLAQLTARIEVLRQK